MTNMCYVLPLPTQYLWRTVLISDNILFGWRSDLTIANWSQWNGSWDLCAILIYE